jgi:death on curing protein
MKTLPLALADVEFIAHRLAQEILKFDEPIPDFSTRFPDRLESCLSAPFQSFGKHDLYKTLIDKASILFYLMIKNHPFQNGNKRVAVTTLLVFLHQNGKWASMHPQDLYKFAVWVAGSNPTAKDGVVLSIRQILEKTLVRGDGVTK